MASGQEHDKATTQWSFLFALSIGFFVGVQSGLIAGLGFLFGGLWLSPDLDTQSRALQRWGVFKVIWKPYRKWIPHRSGLSHSPFLGTFIRISYLIIAISLTLVIVQPFGGPDPVELIIRLKKVIENNSQYALLFILAIEGSAWLHLIQDGDPLPIEWKRKKH